MEENWSFPNLVDSLQAIRNDLEVLRGEHEHIVTASDRDEAFTSTDLEISVEDVLQETKEAVLAESLNNLNGGIEESEILLVVVQYINSLEGDKHKLRAQVRRLADENGWLRQELQRTQQQLQEVESESYKLKEEKQHLEYMVSYSRAPYNTTNNSKMENFSQSADNTNDTTESLDQTTTSVNQDLSSVSLNSTESYTKLHQLAVQHLQQGRHDVALSLCKKAVHDIEMKHGPINADRGDMMNVMVVIYREQKRLKEAAELLQEVLDIREKLNGRDNQMVAATLNNLSVLRGKLGDYKVAESLCRRALEIRQRLLGNSHPDVAQQLVSLASLCQNLGKYEEVEWYYQRAIEIYQGEFGADDENVIKTLNFLGNCYMKQGNLEAAEKVFKRVRSSTTRVQEERESREQSSSPVLLLRTETPEKISSKPLESVRGHTDYTMQRKSSAPNITSTINYSPAKQKGKSSVSENVRKLFKWGGGGTSNTE